jgi:hypothetical protein
LNGYANQMTVNSSRIRQPPIRAVDSQQVNGEGTMKRRFSPVVALFFTLLLTGAPPVRAQESYAALLGKISDPRGAGVAGAKIIVIANDTGLSRTVAGEGARETAGEIAEKLLAQLSPESRLVLVLLHAEEYSSREIAQLMGWTEAKVKTKAFRARHEMRRALARLKLTEKRKTEGRAAAGK